MNKKIANVVFYKFWDPTREEAMQQACIFYEDGTVLNTTHEQGLEAAFELANADKLTGKQFRSMLNKEKVFTLSGEEFERRFQEFVMISRENVKAAVDLAMKDIPATKTGAKVLSKRPANKLNSKDTINPAETTGFKKTTTPATRVAPVIEPDKKAAINPAGTTDFKKTTAPAPRIAPVVIPNNSASAKPKTEATRKPAETTGSKKTEPTTRIAPVVIPNNSTSAKPKTEATRKPTENKSNLGHVENDNKPEEKTTKPKTKAEKAAEAKTKKDSLWTRFKKTKVGKRVTALLVAASLALGLGTGYHLGRNTKAGQILNNNISTMQEYDNSIEAQDAAYMNLLNETKNEDLKTIMTRQGENLDMYNKDFAAAYLEDGKEVKAALSWDEMVALNLAYNDYSKEQIRLMFNGAEVDSLAMSHAYKNATLQLMGAFVIADRENPVNMAALVNSEEGKVFVQKYEDLFYACKEVTGDERVAAVKAFYTELYKDFPISDEIREEGLSHADARKSVKNYMAAVTPMVAAIEIMWQNLPVDHTLTDKATAYFNDIGICNLAEDAFERAETITLTAETDETVPTYAEYMNTKVQELIIEGNYVIDDASRDLSRLDAFQYWVNGNFVLDENGYNTGSITTSTTTYTDTTYHTDTHTSTTQNRNEAVSAVGEDAVEKAEQDADAATQKENADAKQKAEQDAEKKRQEMQEQADQDAAVKEEEVRQDAEDFQDNIDEANSAIDNGGTVTEEDLGHETDFDEDYSNEDGELDSSVTDITTDGSGAVDGEEPLPDPNLTGNSFDNGTSTSTEGYFDEDIYSYEEPYDGGMSNEEIVNAMITEMEAGSNETEPAKQYTK